MPTKALHVEFDLEDYELLSHIRRAKADGKQETWHEALMRIARASRSRKEA